MKSLITLLWFTCSLAQANFIAEVVKLRGKVTKLDPGAQSISKVSKGTKLREDTSLVTGKKSMLRVKFKDGSVVTAGPNSKIVIVEGKKDRGGIVSLLTGRMRAKIQKDKKVKDAKNKFFVKTRSAAMGVRGTEFEVVYNQANQATSLVTLEGNVAMTKVETGKDKLKKVEKQLKEIEKKKKLSKEEKRKVQAELMNKATAEEVKKFVGTKEKIDAKKLDDVLEKSYKVEVKKGRFAGATQHLSKVSEPVKISPVQFKVLRENEELVAKKKSKKVNVEKSVAANVVKDVAKEMNDVDTKDPHPEGFYDKKTDRFAPKSGGFIDMETGLYVPPTKEAKFDKELKVFVATEKQGYVDSETGDYIPPEGLKLDARKGFIVDEKAIKSPKKLKVAKENLVAMRGELNEDISHGINLGKDKEESKVIAKKILSEKKRMQAYEYPFKITLDQRVRSHRVNIDRGSNIEASGKTSSLTRLSLIQGLGGQWQLFQNLGLKRAEYDFGTSLGQNDSLNDSHFIEAGFMYYPSYDFKLLTSVITEEDPILRQNSSGQFRIFGENIVKLRAGFEYLALTKFNFDFTISASAKFLFAKSLDNEDNDGIGGRLSTGLGANITAIAEYRFFSGWTGYILAEHDYERQDSIEYNQKRLNSSIGGGLAYRF